METSTQGRSAPRQTLPPAQVDCKWWKKGYCFRGNDCYFRHNPDLAGIDKPGAAAQHHASSASEKTSIPTAPVQEPAKAAPSASREACGICLEVPATYGLLIHCDHVFCLECIRSWRSSSTAEGGDFDPYGSSDKLKKATKTCPLCRTNSEFIIPSSIFPTPPSQKDDASGETTASSETSKATAEGQNPSPKSNPEKQRIVDTYLAQLKKIPCRYFEESLSAWREARRQHDAEPSTSPSDTWTGTSPERTRPPKLRPRCRFGNHCHYAHIHPVTKEPYIFSSNELSAMKRSRRGGWDSRPRWQPYVPDHSPELTFLEEVIMEFDDLSLNEDSHFFHETVFGELSWGIDFDDDDDDADADAFEDDDEFHDYLVPFF